jgi:hypothetical protein
MKRRRGSHGLIGSTRERPARRCSSRHPVQRRRAFTIQARESNQTPSVLACAASVSRRRPSARSADALPKRASTSFVHVKPLTHSSAAATSRRGQVLTSRQLAAEYDLTDIDGSRPDCWGYIDTHGIEEQSGRDAERFR